MVEVMMREQNCPHLLLLWQREARGKTASIQRYYAIDKQGYHPHSFNLSTVST
jgi:hypothetical protein